MEGPAMIGLDLVHNVVLFLILIVTTYQAIVRQKYRNV
jgi:hypothetical protein